MVSDRVRQISEQHRRKANAWREQEERAKERGQKRNQMARLGWDVQGFALNHPTHEEFYAEWEAKIREYVQLVRDADCFDWFERLVQEARSSTDEITVCAGELLWDAIEDAPQGEIARALELSCECSYMHGLRDRLHDILTETNTAPFKYDDDDSAEAPEEIVDPITIDEMATLVVKTPKTLSNHKGEDAVPGPVTKAGRKKFYSYMAARPWLLKHWPDAADRLPEKYADARKLL